MYIDPFLAGILATIGAEMLALILVAVYNYNKKKDEE